ncbi:DNA cytosine methyltransferase [Burkholderia sp. AcTa6-5]|nr:DNA cytosine methyltransferase [Burkholderia sp. AcTa6-5]
MLGEGVRAALEHFGISHRTACYVEREASAAGQLVTLMEEGALDPAPVWSDLLTFDGSAWRGSVDCVVAGFPCQDISVAGRRAGLDGKRSGLFFNVVDIATDCGAALLILENVSGIISATASVVDEEDGELFERAASRVVGELADRGWHAEWAHIRASDVGGNHQRERWFCFAWRLGNPGVQRCEGDEVQLWEPQPGAAGMLHQSTIVGTGRSELADAGGAGRQQISGGIQAHAHGEAWENGRGYRDNHVPPGKGAGMADAARNGRNEGWPESAWERRGSDAAQHVGTVGDSECAERRSFGIGRGCRESGQDGERQEADWAGVGDAALANPDGMYREQHTWIGAGSGDSPSAGARRESSGRGAWDGELFAPGPGDERWGGIIAGRPDLAPAVESGVRMLADGMACLVDESRNHQLRQIGNGVVPLQAAAALVLLLQRAGLRVIDRKDQS